MATSQLRCSVGGHTHGAVKSRGSSTLASSSSNKATVNAFRSCRSPLLRRAGLGLAAPGRLTCRHLRCSAATDEAAEAPAVSQAPAAAEAAPASRSVQQIREARLQPLKVALQDAIALHTKATGVREALEAEVCALFEQAINAEGLDVDLDQVAAAAMAAVEGAVKDEVEAAAVVSATQTAIANTLKDLQAISGRPEEAAAIQEIAAALQSVDAASSATVSTDAKSSSATPAADAIQLLDSLTASAGGAAAAGGLLQAVEKGAVGAPSSNGTPAGSAAPSAAVSPAPSPMPTGAAPPGDAKKSAGMGKLLQAAGFAVAAALAVAFVKSAAGEALIASANGLVSSIAERIGPIHINPAEQGLLETIWLLLTSIICVPAVCKFIPGGSPVLGYLIGGALVGPHALNIISDVHAVQHLAELGVVFLLFNIGLELSLERLQSMAKYVFGMGAAQVVLTLLGVAGFALSLAGLAGPSAIILGGALAMSTTAVAIQVLEDRGEMGSRHGRATFSVLLFQDLAVVVLLMLIPLLAPDPSGANSGGMSAIATALGIAAVKAVVAIVGITAGGRMFIRPLYKKISNMQNSEIFAATTLLVVLGTSFMTQLAGLSLALGAFLAGLLIAETEYALQVESDIAPYKGLLMGLFFMTVGMNISVQLFAVKWKMIMSAMVVLLVGKLAVMVAAGQMFGLSRMASLRAGLLLASGGEFAFVAFGEAVSKGVLPAALTSELYMVVALSMAMVPYLAALGGKLGVLFEKSDIKTLQPQEDEVKELRNHVIIAGYGRVGQIIAQMLSELLIPFVALDVRSDRVASGKSSDLPVYFGDAGSPAVLHSVGAERAACAVITLDTPGANYRSVWAMHKHFPEIKTYVRAHDVNHGINLEKAGATVVVPETLEPSMQLAASVLSQFKLPPEEINTHLDNFRKKHLRELQALAALSGTSLGYLAPKEPKEEKKELAPTATIDVDAETAVVSPTPA